MERVTFLWKRLSFLVKVSCRNVFRYKKRLFMMLVGIGGCTALLLTGFGIRDSIQDFINYQYEDISLYDCVVNFDESLDDSTKENFLEECGSSVEDMAVVHMSTVEFHDSELPFSANLVATDDSLEGFMDFHDGSTPLSYPGEGECLISRGISDQLNYQAGDVITVYDSDFNALTLTVTGVFDNYIDDYIYTTPDSILSFGSNYHPETAYVRYAEGTTASEVTAVITGVEHVISAMDTASQQSRVNSMLSSIDYIVIMIVIFAAALAFIVLYNLTNINITERTREIATIQVLGFYPNETATYVFRENLMLSFLGAAVGLPLGKLLHSYVMHQVNVDGIYFDIRIKLLSYVGALALTLIFAWIVNGLMTFKLRRINMAESLKSVE